MHVYIQSFFYFILFLLSYSFALFLHFFVFIFFSLFFGWFGARWKLPNTFIITYFLRRAMEKGSFHSPLFLRLSSPHFFFLFDYLCEFFFFFQFSPLCCCTIFVRVNFDKSISSAFIRAKVGEWPIIHGFHSANSP
jgi:hypothetical protein